MVYSDSMCKYNNYCDSTIIILLHHHIYIFATSMSFKYNYNVMNDIDIHNNCL